ncbi:hypothetical protein C493_05465 [Natronolimnohabitans innermongolicus JCM 12255]|uniref:Uncharacterized protein n=1 Tax=Natronolimnohabitans innermongolicus JCM 12255 TaxID=1227499 RepID=L9XEK7_9EURY|nr:hypothetical protein C493_05465 [Natronolimnohabitans innermongolicus JCM 12255]
MVRRRYAVDAASLEGASDQPESEGIEPVAEAATTVEESRVRVEIDGEHISTIVNDGLCSCYIVHGALSENVAAGAYARRGFFAEPVWFEICPMPRKTVGDGRTDRILVCSRSATGIKPIRTDTAGQTELTIGRATAVVAVGADRDVATDCSLTAVQQYGTVIVGRRSPGRGNRSREPSRTKRRDAPRRYWFEDSLRL